MKTKFLTGQDVIANHQQTGMAISGFNRRIQGYSYSEAFQYPNEKTNSELNGGWDLADKMIKDGRLFYVHDFHNLTCKNGYAFHYGGSWACNTCNNDHFDKEWWKIKVFKDGDEWCCIGADFENLQESDCYAFGKTREESINNYGNLMLNKV
jgi:hypothetical protein